MAQKRVVSRSSYVDPSKAGEKKSAGTERVYRGTVEAQWTCSSCGRTGIPGRQKRCPSCGNPKDRDEVYEAPTGTTKYLTSDELKAMGVDPTQHLSDEECEYCGAKLQPGTQKCPNCGAVLGDVGYTTRHCPACGFDSNEEKCPNCGSPTEEKLTAHRAATPPPPPPPPAPTVTPPFYKNPKAIITIIIGLLLLCGCVCALISAWPRNEVATVSALTWERQIAIEEHQYNRHESWSPPAGADIEAQEQRISHYDQVQIGTEEECGYEEECETHSVYDHTEHVCYDDGTCDEEDVYRDERTCDDVYVCETVPVYEDVPRYATWYTYHVWEWVDVEPARARGNDNAPYWPEVQLGPEQREGARTEKCTVTFTNEKGKSYPFAPPCAELGKYEPGSEWQITHDANSVQDVAPAE